MSLLPNHGCINCSRCFNSEHIVFDVTKVESEGWRITANPLSWGTSKPEIIVLGFSKGPTQTGALNKIDHNQIAYKSGRSNIAKIFKHIGLISLDSEDPKNEVNRIISDHNGRFHFGSLIRCTVERYDSKSKQWKGTGGGMLDKFIKTDFGKNISSNCIQQHLSDLPKTTKLVIMFGLGSKLNYVQESYKLFQNNLSGDWQMKNDVSYTNSQITVVHVEHFAAQGALIPNWLGLNNHPRSYYGQLAKLSVLEAIDR